MRNDQIFKGYLLNALKTCLLADISPDEVQVTIPSHQAFGDYTSNCSLLLYKKYAKQHYQSPIEFANAVVSHLYQLDDQKLFDVFEVKSPGFINAKLSIKHLIQSLTQPQSQQFVSDQKILVEFVGPNTNKQLHIGHVLNAVLGHSLINILRRAGYTVYAGTISNDRGIHIMKSMYGYLKSAYAENLKKDPQSDGLTTSYLDELDYKILLEQWLQNPKLWKTPKDLDIKPDHFIGWCYIQGNQLAESSESAQEEMQKMLRAWESGDTDVRTLWMQTNTWFYEGYHQTLHNLNIYASIDKKNFFDYVWYESEIYKRGKDIILENIGNGLIKEYEDGHVEAELEEKYGIPNIVLLRKDKSALYITQDVELLRNRLEDYNFDKVIYVVDYRQTLQFNQLFKIVASFGIEKAINCLHKSYGEVRTPQGPMSSRKGNIITADWLIAETQKRALAEINNEQGNIQQTEKEHISQHVALAALKYGLLKFNSITNIIFDINKNVSFEGDTGPYIQYTYARCCSILKKIQGNAQHYNLNLESINNHQNLAEELVLLRHLEKFDIIVDNAAQEMLPNIICEYLYDLAQQFNNIYATKPILKEENHQIKQLRIFTTDFTKKILFEGLELLGIKPLEKM